MENNLSKIYEDLGKLVFSFQGLERAVERMIFSCMTSTYSQVRIIMSEISFKAKINVMNSLIKDLHKPGDIAHGLGNIYESLESIVKRCHSSETRRNQLLHSAWVPGFKSAPDLVMRLKDSAKSKNGYKYSVESFKSDTLNRDIEFINETKDQLLDFCQKLSMEFKRVHGIPGMENCFDHRMLVNQIYEAVITSSKNSEKADP